jgi:hypothetical protein
MRPPCQAHRACSLLVLTVLASSSLGCLPSIDDSVKKHGPGARATLTALAPIAEELRKLPPVPRDDAAPLEGSVVLDIGGSGATAALVYLEDLRAPGELGAIYARVPISQRVPECAAFLEHKTYPWDPRNPQRWSEAVVGLEVASRLEECGRLRTLFVVRTLEFVRPMGARVEATADAGASRFVSADVSEDTCAMAGRRCAFDGGHLKAEVHVYSLSPVARRGAFLVDVESSDKLLLSGVANDQLLESDLLAQVKSAIAAGIVKRLPTANVSGLQ